MTDHTRPASHGIKHPVCVSCEREYHIGTGWPSTRDGDRICTIECLEGSIKGDPLRAARFAAEILDYGHITDEARSEVIAILALAATTLHNRDKVEQMKTIQAAAEAQGGE